LLDRWRRRKAELDRRIEEMDRNPDAGVPWEVAKTRVLGRLRK
jgi:putative addiction module component (TIGR02574 family)